MASIRSMMARDDTVLGACFALGRDFGFNPIWLRLLFALSLFWSRPWTLAGYFALWTLVAFSHWLFPDPVPVEAAEDEPDCQGAPCEEFRLAA